MQCSREVGPQAHSLAPPRNPYSKPRTPVVAVVQILVTPGGVSVSLPSPQVDLNASSLGCCSPSSCFAHRHKDSIQWMVLGPTRTNQTRFWRIDPKRVSTNYHVRSVLDIDSRIWVKLMQSCGFPKMERRRRSRTIKPPSPWALVPSTNKNSTTGRSS